MNFNVPVPDENLLTALRQKIDSKTKPVGSLGKLEELAIRCGLMQQTLLPQVSQPHLLVFAADHGIAATGQVNPFPQEVTRQMVQNFLNGGAAINVICRANGIPLKVVNAGVKGNAEFDDPHHLLLNIPIAEGTKNYLEEPAMSEDVCKEAIRKGAILLNGLHSMGCNTIGIGEMGIGNSSSAALIMHALTGIPLSECVGLGTGQGDSFLQQKLSVLEKAAAARNIAILRNDPFKLLQEVGGLEIAMMTGAYCKAAELRMTIVVDGFISTAAWLAAWKLHPDIFHYTVFSHCSEEKGHALLLKKIGVEPLLQLNMRLGEGTGAALAIPLLSAATALMREMASFDAAGVSTKEE